MPIRFSCPACQQLHTVRDELADKAVLCGCGSRVRVPSGTPAKTANVPAAKSQHNRQQAPRRPSPAAVSFAPVVNSSASVSNAWMAQQSLPPTKPKERSYVRYVVALAAILSSFVNSVLAFLMYQATDLPTPPLIFLDIPFVFWGAVLITMENRWGPSLTALAILFGGFIQAWLTIGAGIKHLYQTGHVGLIAGTVMMSIVPTIIFFWCIREEKRRPVLKK